MTRRKLLSDKCIGIGVLYTDEKLPGEQVKIRLKTEEGQVLPGSSISVSYEMNVAKTYSKDFSQAPQLSSNQLKSQVTDTFSGAVFDKKKKMISVLDISDQAETKKLGKPPKFKLPFWMDVAQPLLPRSARSILEGHAGGTLKITVDRGHGLVAADASVYTLGLGSNVTSDPYVLIYTRQRSQTEFKTECITSTLCPYFNERFEIPIYDPADELVFDVFDRDVSSNDDNIGSCVIQMADLPLNRLELNSKNNQDSVGIRNHVFGTMFLQISCKNQSISS